MLDNKGSILKPMVSGTPITVRGALQHPTTAGAGALPIAPFTIRATTIQRPQTSIVASASTTQ